MDVTTMLIVVFVVMLVGFVATIMVGKSKSNQAENPGYMQKTGSNWLRLTLIYVVAIVAVAVIYFAFIR